MSFFYRIKGINDYITLQNSGILPLFFLFSKAKPFFVYDGFKLVFVVLKKHFSPLRGDDNTPQFI